MEANRTDIASRFLAMKIVQGKVPSANSIRKHAFMASAGLETGLS